MYTREALKVCVMWWAQAWAKGMPVEMWGLSAGGKAGV